MVKRIDPSALGLSGFTQTDILDRLKTCYGI